MPKTLVRQGPKHGALHKSGARKPLRKTELPRWAGWRHDSEAQRIIRWCEEVLVLPRGHGGGERFKVAPYQRKFLSTFTDSLATFASIPAGNGKTTFMAAVALERLCRGDDYVEIDVLATKEDQAQRMVEAVIRFIETSPELRVLADDGAIEYWARDSTLEFRLTGSIMRAHSSRLSAVQGLDFSLALIDEIGFVPPEIATALIARLGKQADGRVVGFGTPGFGQDNMLEQMRVLAHAAELPAGVAFVEYAADAGCDIHDRAQWRKANPALKAGFLREDALAVQAATMPEYEFRAYHLGQPVESSGPWLPHGAWDACVHADVPRDGSAVVLAVWGNYQRRLAIVGATLDGALFFGWQAEKAADAEVAAVLRAATEQWNVLELCHKPHIRHGLMATLAEEGLPVVSWPADTATDVDSTSSFYQAIAEGGVAHDHDPVLAEQVARLTAKVDRHGNPRLVESEQDVAAALAARAAWWRARLMAESPPTEELMIW